LLLLARQQKLPVNFSSALTLIVRGLTVLGLPPRAMDYLGRRENGASLPKECQNKT